MIVKGINKKIALLYIKSRIPIDSYVYDPVRSQPYCVTKYSIFEVHSDQDQVIEFDPHHEEYTFLVRNPGNNSPLYHVKSNPKRWILDWFLNTNKRPKNKTAHWIGRMQKLGFTNKEIDAIFVLDNPMDKIKAQP